MNTIPSVGPDTAIAPRTGSGSPQTPSQQRTDSAPAVLSDNPATAADPGVMLKIAPPVQARQGDAKVSEQLQNRALSDWASLISDPDVLQVAALTGSAKEADEAIQSRVAQAFAALPVDVQEAIRLASTPAIAKLLRLAAITAPGIKEAPAMVQTGTTPMGEEVTEALTLLRQVLQQSPAFKLAALLQELGGFRVPTAAFSEHGQDGIRTGLATQSSQAGQQALSLEGSIKFQATEVQQVTQAQVSLKPNAPDGQQLQQTARLESPQIGLTLIQASEGSVEGKLFDGPMGQPVGSPHSRNGLGQELQATARIIDTHPDASDVALQRQLPAEFMNAKPSTVFGQNMSLASEHANVLTGSINSQFTLGSAAMATGNQGSSAHHTEAAIRDGLRLLMDGRMLWQGQLTPGVPMQFERSDTWRTNRRLVGGMEKGTSLKVTIQLPNMGPLEVRAMGFGGQVSVRLHADPSVTPAVASAIPELQSRLKERGLAGAQVLLDSL